MKLLPFAIAALVAAAALPASAQMMHHRHGMRSCHMEMHHHHRVQVCHMR